MRKMMICLSILMLMGNVWAFGYAAGNGENQPNRFSLEEMQMLGDAQMANQMSKHKEAAKLYLKLAERGNKQGQLSLADMYMEGKGVKKDYSEAAKWYRKAAEQGMSIAQFKLACMYETGQGVAQDYTEAAKWHLLAAEQGQPGAQGHLGKLYETGKGVPQDYPEAVKWYQKAVDQQSYPAFYDLGMCYKLGKGVPKNLSKARDLFEYAVFANPDAKKEIKELDNLLAQERNSQNSSVQNVTAQSSSTNQAGQSIQVSATPSLTPDEMTDKGRAAEQRSDYAEALKWYRKAAEQGNADAQYSLGCLYFSGKGVTEDTKEAVKWFEKASAQGHKKAKEALDTMNSVVNDFIDILTKGMFGL